MKYIISSIIFFLILIHPVFAQEEMETPNWFEEKITSPMKHFFNSMKQNNLEDKSQEILEKTQNTIEEKQEELVDKAVEKTKKESKEMIKNWFQRKVAWIENVLSPLKIRIQQGSDWIREKIGSIRN